MRGDQIECWYCTHRPRFVVIGEGDVHEVCRVHLARSVIDLADGSDLYLKVAPIEGNTGE